jgi:hypothetical protein
VTVKVFVSYARDDDAVPAEEQANKGFVSFLYNQLVYEFRRLGPTRPKLWRDIECVDKGEEFAQRFEEELATSALLLIILSRNWMDRAWCQRELDLFTQKWGVGGEGEVRKRVVFAAKHFIPVDARPAVIQGKEGYDFFSRDLDAGHGNRHEREFFDRGAVRDQRYYERVSELGRYLYQLAQQYDSDGRALASRPSSNGAATEAASPGRRIEAPVQRPSEVQSNKSRRTVYVAQPAADMRQSYDRVVAELLGRGFAVLPNPGSQIPNDSTAVDFIDTALSTADLSVHLIGDKLGYAPEDAEPILKLQLRRAALQVELSPSTNRPVEFFRLIWAPRVVPTEGPAAGEPRDPIALVSKFDRQLASDKIEGETVSKFIDFLIQRIDRTEAPRAVPDLIESDTRVYINHRIEDTEHAIELGRVLAQRRIEVIWPNFEGDPAELRALHRENLRDADAVMLCWAKAPDVWVSKAAQELRSWRDLGRSERFSCRLLVAVPPPGLTKKRLLTVPPRSDIDAVLDLTNSEAPPPEAFDSLIHASR